MCTVTHIICKFDSSARNYKNIIYSDCIYTKPRRFSLWFWKYQPDWRWIPCIRFVRQYCRMLQTAMYLCCFAMCYDMRSNDLFHLMWLHIVCTCRALSAMPINRMQWWIRPGPSLRSGDRCNREDDMTMTMNINMRGDDACWDGLDYSVLRCIAQSQHLVRFTRQYIQDTTMQRTCPVRFRIPFLLPRWDSLRALAPPRNASPHGREEHRHILRQRDCLHYLGATVCKRFEMIQNDMKKDSQRFFKWFDIFWFDVIWDGMGSCKRCTT